MDRPTQAVQQFSPHAWGWTEGGGMELRVWWVFPTRVGVDRRRTRLSKRKNSFSPHAWGWTCAGWGVFPTRVGPASPDRYRSGRPEAAEVIMSEQLRDLQGDSHRHLCRYKCPRSPVLAPHTCRGAKCHGAHVCPGAQVPLVRMTFLRAPGIKGWQFTDRLPVTLPRW